MIDLEVTFNNRKTGREEIIAVVPLELVFFVLVLLCLIFLLCLT